MSAPARAWGDGLLNQQRQRGVVVVHVAPAAALDDGAAMAVGRFTRTVQTSVYDHEGRGRRADGGAGLLNDAVVIV